MSLDMTHGACEMLWERGCPGQLAMMGKEEIRP